MKNNDGQNTLERVRFESGAPGCDRVIPDENQELWRRLGINDALTFVSVLSAAAWAENLTAIKNSKAYKTLGLSWEEFCDKYTPYTRRYADQLVADFKELGKAFFHVREIAHVSREAYINSDAVEIEEGKIKIGNDVYPMTRSYAPQIQAAFKAQEEKVQGLQGQLSDAKKGSKKAQEKAKRLEETNQALNDTIREMKDTSRRFPHATERQRRLMEAQALGVRMVETIHAVANDPETSDLEMGWVRGLGEYMIKLIMTATCDDPLDRTMAQKLGGTDLIDEYNREHGINEKIVDLNSRRPQ
jgi:hypothetical protein